MGHGVTLGGAFALHMGRILPNKSVSQDVSAVSFMPYVLLAPAYWASSVGTLCAAHLSASEEALKPLRERHNVQGSLNSACIWHKFGFYFGVPFAYDVSTTAARATQGQRIREVHPLASTGIAFSPSAVFSTLLGMTFSEVHRDDGTGATLVTPTISLGINLDALHLLF